MAGYSQTPLAKKLGIKEGFTIKLVNEPSYYLSLFADFPTSINYSENENKHSIDFIHLFCTTFKELENNAPSLKNQLKKDGLLWISWPKGSSGIITDLKRDPIREYLLDLGLVDVKVCAVDEKWSGLKFVYRIKDR
jgi:hypothetical protein